MIPMPNTQKIAHQCFLKKDLGQKEEKWKEKVKWSHYCSESSKMKLEAIKEMSLNAHFLRIEFDI